MTYTLATFYTSRAWRDFLAVISAERRQPDGLIYCAICGKPIVGKYQMVGHHKKELTDENVNDPRISLARDNVDLVDAGCHNRSAHNKFAKNMLGVKIGKSVFLVYGPPLAGKTSAVRSIAKDTDIIVDYDALHGAMIGGDTYGRNVYGKTLIFEVRNLLIDRIKTRAGQWETAYIIGGYPFISERERLCAELGAKELCVSASKEECLARLEADEERDKALWRGYIEDWYEKYEPTPAPGTGGSLPR